MKNERMLILEIEISTETPVKLNGRMVFYFIAHIRTHVTYDYIVLFNFQKTKSHSFYKFLNKRKDFHIFKWSGVWLMDVLKFGKIHIGITEYLPKIWVSSPIQSKIQVFLLWKIDLHFDKPKWYNTITISIDYLKWIS